MYDYDVIIVGAGPAGCAAAIHLANLAPARAERSLLLDRAHFPRPKLCGGGITHRADALLDRLGVAVSVPAVQVHESHHLFPDRAEVRRGGTAFRVVRREEFDFALFQAARDRGVATVEGEPVVDLRHERDAVVVCTATSRYRARLVIGADGANGVIRRKLGLLRPDRMMLALEVLTPPNRDEAATFDMGRAVFDFTPAGVNGYYWDFPSLKQGTPTMNRGIVDTGIGGRAASGVLKGSFAAALRQRGVALETCRLQGHPARWYDAGERHCAPRVLLAGDAAGCDPLLGEGITPALGLGMLAAETAADALARDDYRFADYEQRIQASDLGRWLCWQRLKALGFYGDLATRAAS